MECGGFPRIGSRRSGWGLLRQLFHMRNRGEPHVPSAPQLETAAAATAAPQPAVITLPERLDALAARDTAFWPTVTGASVVLDAGATTFIDSTGTGRIVRLARTARERGGKCILAGASPVVLKALDLMKLRDVFTEAPDLATALTLLP